MGQGNAVLLQTYTHKQTPTNPTPLTQTHWQQTLVLLLTQLYCLTCKLYKILFKHTFTELLHHLDFIPIKHKDSGSIDYVMLLINL